MGALVEDPGFNLPYDDVLARLLAGPALLWTEEAGGCWLAARYSDVRACAIDWETFSSAEHRCLGAPIVRLEMPIVLDIVLRRLPGLGLAGEPAFTRRQLRPNDSLPVAFDTVEHPR